MNQRLSTPSVWELARQVLSSTRVGYDLLAPKFEATLYATPQSYIERALERVESLYPIIRESEEIRGLDLACGTGRGVRALRRYCDSVEGVDFSSAMLQEAKTLSGGLDKLSWHLGELSALELSSESYDRVVTFGAWGHILPNFRNRLLRQIVSSLKMGGVFVTLTATAPSWRERRYWYSLVFDNLIRLRNAFWFHEFHMYYGLNHSRDLEAAFRTCCEELLGSEGFVLTTEPFGEGGPEALSILTLRRGPSVE